MPDTPILPCHDFPSIRITPSSSSASSSSHPLDSPSFDVPPSVLLHLETASRHLHNHQTVAVPTETVYGLAASSLDPDAVKAIYRIKNRPADNPLIIHVSSLDMLRSVIPQDYVISRLYMALISAFWPGPLSILFPSPNPPPPPAPQTNAIRMPSHPLALALIHHSNLPLSAPSANSSGRPSPTQAQHVWNDLNGSEGLGCILDGGDCGVGVESTVINGLKWKEGGGGEVDVLRPGGLGVEEIKRIVDQVDGQEGLTKILVHGKPWKPAVRSSVGTRDTTEQRLLAVSAGTAQANGVAKVKPIAELPPSTPGMKYRHYSPRVPVFLLEPSNVFPRPSSLSDEAESSAQAVLRQIQRRVAASASSGKGKLRIGVLSFDNSPLSRQLQLASAVHAQSNSGVQDEKEYIELIKVSLGDSAASAAQKLFAGMLTLERVPADAECKGGKLGVDAILIEGCSDEGLGLAVMERVIKAVGGGGVVGDLANGQETNGSEGEQRGKERNRFWVDVGAAA
ncbi:Sua5/YciO/YrdC/YwlC family protein [Kwoniella heveanensis CBS 569]|uniref:Threonylcarbamoyl-AMP synthase n=1 Tax=Kwoniella heveanensis BCC8398 TaxID=1296120 RepID=A0A1B9H004_9TREE|nr:Sua5/YciO/YrdC/YwlC family protein [Kwoniella heveanensis BCC8398]OCF45422.1 Sua5/YciO/YrdC/YwlC family protein [Kwoniella heveanensis CBS 569]